MKKYISKLVEPYYLKRSKKGVLMIHGFSGTPAKLYFIKEYLRKKTDYTISIPLLSGHGTKIKDMEDASWEDWIKDVTKAYNQLAKDCTHISVVGFSMGGLLALILASKKPVERLITIAPALFVKDKLSALAPIGKYFLHYHSAKNFKKTFPDEADQYDLKYNLGYNKYPVKNIEDLLKLESETKAVLSKIDCPTLIIQSVKDDMVDPISALFIEKNIGSEHKEIAWLDESRHLCPLGPEKEIIHKHILDFLTT